MVFYRIVLTGDVHPSRHEIAKSAILSLPEAKELQFDTPMQQVMSSLANSPLDGYRRSMLIRSEMSALHSKKYGSWEKCTPRTTWAVSIGVSSTSSEKV